MSAETADRPSGEETTFIGRAPGKLILLGEHAVVYGHRAIAVAVDRFTTVRLRRHAGATQLGRTVLRDPRLHEVIALSLPPQGWRVDITTELPVGRGMGSSAALTIALLRARAALEGREPDFAWLHAEGFQLERVFHGAPSGVDHAVSALQQAVLYRKGEAPTPLALPPHPLVVLDSGVAGDTKALVAGVASRRPAVDPALERLGALVEEALPLLTDAPALGELMNEAQHLLTEIGVSTPQLQALVRLARDNGAVGAKLAGAGGGGVVCALTPDGGEGLLRAARSRGIHAFRCQVPET